jgi:hypothetical protein
MATKVQKRFKDMDMFRTRREVLNSSWQKADEEPEETTGEQKTK